MLAIIVQKSWIFYFKSVIFILDHTLRVDHDHSQSDMEAMENRHKNEAESYRSRLKRTEQLLEESRAEFLEISDTKSRVHLPMISASTSVG